MWGFWQYFVFLMPAICQILFWNLAICKSYKLHMDGVLTARDQYACLNLNCMCGARPYDRSRLCNKDVSPHHSPRLSHTSAEGRSRLKLALQTGLIVPSCLFLLAFSIYHPVNSCCHPPTTPPAAHNICSHLLFHTPIRLGVLLSCLIIINELHGVPCALIDSLVSHIMADKGKPAMQAINRTASLFYAKLAE